MMTYATALREATQRLARTSSTARLDAELLLAHICHVRRIQLLVEWETPLTAEQMEHFQVAIERRAAGEPVAYLVGTKEFYGRPFMVDQRVLVPRPETELLVEHALAWAHRQSGALQIADIGTGSGCLAITLALEIPDARVLAVDLSPDALIVASHNIARYALEEQITLVQGDGLAPLHDHVDLLVSNPPYMTLDQVDPQVRRWEPHLALDGGGPDGLQLPVQILRAAPQILAPCGALFMEIADWQGATMMRLAHQAFGAAVVGVYQDLAGQDRLLAVESSCRA